LLLLRDEAAKPRDIKCPLSAELGRAGDLAPLCHGLQFAMLESEDGGGLRERAALGNFGTRLALTAGRGEPRGNGGEQLAALAPEDDHRRMVPRNSN
jgi:hypothetical protein